MVPPRRRVKGLIRHTSGGDGGSGKTRIQAADSCRAAAHGRESVSMNFFITKLPV
jgi:hypothetical protein